MEPTMELPVKREIVKSISYDEQEIIRNILDLHCDGSNIDLDPTYSKGNFYNKGLQQPTHKFDKFPQTDNTVQALSSDLPLEDESINTIMFDPPFLISGQNYKNDKEGSSIIAKRFEAFQSWEQLKEMYSLSLREFRRILKPNGIVIFKCQDTVSSSKQHFTHSWVMYEAIKQGFYPKDMFILLAKARLTDKRKQQHTRKYHSYYIVLQKKPCKVDYDICEC